MAGRPLDGVVKRARRRVKTDAPSVVVAEFPCAVCGARLDSLHVDLGLEGTIVCSFCGAPQSERNGGGSRPTGPAGPRSMSLLETSDLLRDARERRRESLEEVAEATGIRRSYLEELEAGDASFEPYPGRVYGRFFLREYAEHLGLDPAPLIDAFDGEARSDGAVQRDERRIPRRRRSPSALLVAAVCLVAVFAARALLPGEDRPASAFPTQYAPVSARRHVQAPHAPTDHRPVDRIRAVATLTGASWVEVLSDGRSVYRAIAAEGTILRFEADRRLELTFGSGGYVALEVNGRRESTGPVGDVVHLAFQLRNGAVRWVQG